MIMGRRHNYHKGQAALRIYANQPTHQCLKFKTDSSRFQPGEDPSRNLLRDCENWKPMGRLQP